MQHSQYCRNSPTCLPNARVRTPFLPATCLSRRRQLWKPHQAPLSRSRLVANDSKDSSLESTSTSASTVQSNTFPRAPPPKEGPSADLNVIFTRLQTLALPYWTEGTQASGARWRLAGVVALTLGTTGVSVLFNFLGRDFFNALSAKDQAKFTEMLAKWLGALCLGIPVFVLRDYYQSRLALEWRAWMTETITEEYFAGRTFYRLQADALLDNPDQRIAVDVRSFTDTTLAFAVTMLNSAVDLISFSGILFSIYPPLFAALLIYSVGGTAASLAIGRPLVGLNFAQEAAEADFRYGLVRVRENAESIAFYGGEGNEARLLGGRLRAAIDNFGGLLLASRNLSFFTSFYRFLIQILPAAVVAPLYFRGEIEFGVVNQSASAFNHILSDVSLVVYQFEALAGFSAVIDRLGELQEMLRSCKDDEDAAKTAATSATTTLHKQLPVAAEDSSSDEEKESSSTNGDLAPPPSTPRADTVAIIELPPGSNNTEPLLELKDVNLRLPGNGTELIHKLSLQVDPGHSLLIMGPSGSGKTSLLRTVAGLWRSGSGIVAVHGRPAGRVEGEGEVFFVPQRPYVVLGTLRDQLLYPTWTHTTATTTTNIESNGNGKGLPTNSGTALKNADRPDPGYSETEGAKGVTLSAEYRDTPKDAALREALERVQLGSLLERVGGDLDALADWASVLSLGEQQRLAFARVLLCRPRLVLMDESTSALDTRNERILYGALKQAGITYVSIGHRPTLLGFHERVLVLAGDGKGSWEVRAASEVSLETAVELME